MAVTIVIVLLIVIYATYKENTDSSSTQPTSRQQYKVIGKESLHKQDIESNNSEKIPLHPKNNRYNFAGYVTDINWYNTKDSQLQCWLTIVSGEQEKEMSKYIKKDMIGTLQQYKAIKINDYVHVTYVLRKGYKNIKTLRVLKTGKLWNL